MVLVPTVGYAKHYPPPTVTLTAKPSTVEKGQSGRLSWTSQNATDLKLAPGVGKVGGRGSTTVTPQRSTTYTLTATGPGGTRTATARVTVTVPPPPPTVTLTAKPSTVEEGQSSTLSWTSQDATDLELAPGVGKVGVQGSTTVTPQRSTTYTLTATGPGGTQTATARVTVTDPPPPPPKLPPNTLQLTDWDGEYWDGTSNYWIVKEATSGLPIFAFPQASTPAWLDYLIAIQQEAVSISGTLTMTVEVTVVGDPIFNWQSESDNTCYWAPATVRPFFEGTHNTNTTGRWWAIPPNDYVLAPGSMVITVPLTPANWSDVNGQNGASSSQTIAGFADSLNNLSMIGMTFGGGCFYGHGVNVSGGTAEFRVLDYRIIP